MDAKPSLWTHTETKTLKAYAGKLSAKAIGEMLGRTDEAVRNYAKRKKIRLQRYGEHCQTAKYSNAVCEQARQLYGQGVRPKQIAEHLGVPWSAVKDFITHKRI